MCRQPWCLLGFTAVKSSIVVSSKRTYNFSVEIHHQSSGSFEPGFSRLTRIKSQPILSGIGLIYMMERRCFMADINTIISSTKMFPGGLIEAYRHSEGVQLHSEEAITELLGYFRYPLPKRTGLRPSIPISRSERGRYVIRLCESSPCHIAGAAEVVAALEGTGYQDGRDDPRRQVYP